MKNNHSSTWANRIGKYYFPVQDKSEMAANLKRNWYFPISAGAFFCLEARFDAEYLLGFLAAFALSVLIAAQSPSMIDFIKKNPIGLKAVSILTAAGICLAGRTAFCDMWQMSPITQALETMIPTSVNLAGMISAVGMVASGFYVFFFILLFWNSLYRTVQETGLFNNIKTVEWILIGIMFLITVVYVTVSFTKTDAFYGTVHDFDIIYTSDSPSLVKDNVYLVLTHPENDLRQPLFAIFAAPFLGIAYLLGRLTGGSAAVSAILMNSVQIGLLFAANYMLAKLMGLDSRKRICFVIISCCTYTHLLFSLMMEQYIVAYFWLMLCVYVICEQQRPYRAALWGAGGTLLTSMVLLPMMSDKHPLRDFKAWLLDMIRFGMEFVAVMLIFCRLDVIAGVFTKVKNLNTFAGHELTLLDKFCQYTAFVSGIFAAPNAGENTAFAAGHISWQLQPVTGISMGGIVILLLALLGAALNWQKKSTRIALGWAGFSLIMLVGLGWGTAENGLILYALYFGWAFCLLLFQLAERLEKAIRVKWLIPAFTFAAGACLLCVNIPAIREMIRFAVNYFPL